MREKEKASGSGNIQIHIPDGCFGVADEHGEFPKARLILEKGKFRIEMIEQTES